MYLDVDEEKQLRRFHLDGKSYDYKEDFHIAIQELFKINIPKDSLVEL